MYSLDVYINQPQGRHVPQQMTAAISSRQESESECCEEEQYSERHSLRSMCLGNSSSFLLFRILMVWLRPRILMGSSSSCFSSFSMKDLASSSNTSSISCMERYCSFLLMQLPSRGVSSPSSSSTMLCRTGLPNFYSMSNFTSFRYSFSKSFSSLVLKLTEPLRCLMEASSLKRPEIFFVQLLPHPLLSSTSSSSGEHDLCQFLFRNSQLTARFLSLLSWLELTMPPTPKQELWLFRNLPLFRSLFFRFLYYGALFIFSVSAEFCSSLVEMLLLGLLTHFRSED